MSRHRYNTMFRFKSSRSLLLACMDFLNGKGCRVQPSEDTSGQIKWRELPMPPLRDDRPSQLIFREMFDRSNQDAFNRGSDPIEVVKRDAPKQSAVDKDVTHGEGCCVQPIKDTCGQIKWRELPMPPFIDGRPCQLIFNEMFDRSNQYALKRGSDPIDVKRDAPKQSAADKDVTPGNGCCVQPTEDTCGRIKWRELPTPRFRDGHLCQLSFSEMFARCNQDALKRGNDPIEVKQFTPKKSAAVLSGGTKKDSPNQYVADLSDGGRIKRFDWRDHGAITPVRDQKECGCCYAIATIGSIEALGKITTGELVELSLQQLIDCDLNNNNDGCYHGKPQRSFEYVMKFGVTTEKNYPSKAHKFRMKKKYQPVYKRYKSCKKIKTESVASITGFKYVQRLDGDALEAAVLINPVVVTISVNQAFRNYTGGIITSYDCPRPTDSELDDPNFTVHNVLLIGFDEDGTTGLRWWVFKNSWGVDWGENGYFKVLRDVSDPWGVLAMYAVPGIYPTSYFHRRPIPPAPATQSSGSFFGNIAVKAKELLHKDNNSDQNFSSWTAAKSGLPNLQHSHPANGVETLPFRTGAAAARVFSVDGAVETRYGFTSHGLAVALEP